VLAHGAWVFCLHTAGPLRSPWSRDYGEGSVLAMAQLLASGRSYFVDLQDYPYLLGNYPPVFVGLTALAQLAFGPTLWAPRLLALVSTLGALALVYAVLARLLNDRVQALAFAALGAMPWFVTTWAALARVDTLAIVLSLATLALVLRRGVGPSAWPALVLSWLAFFTKHNALLVPAAVLLELLLARDRRLPRVLAAWALPLAALFGALVLATGGGAWRHLVTWTALADYEWGRMAAAYLQLAVIAAPLLALIAAALVAAPRQLLAGPGRLVFLYFALNLAAFATIAKAGAAQNYFIEPWLATLLLAALALRALGRRVPALAAGWPAVLLVAAAVANYAYPSLDRMPAALRRPENARDFVALTRLVRETRGEILSENMSLLVVNRRPVLFDAWGMEMLGRKGVFHAERVVRDCELGRFALVVVEYRLAQIPGLGECLDRRYEPVADLGAYHALRPRR
jgi:4-amino-4-deoxy-L-arabinose transferase-like glycosyltransferase